MARPSSTIRLGADLGAATSKGGVQYDAGLILNHMRGTPETWAKTGAHEGRVGTLIAELEAAVHRAVRGGVPAIES